MENLLELKHQPSRKLEHPHGAGRGNVAKSGRGPVPAGIAEVDMVERVVRIHTDVKGQPLVELESLRHGRGEGDDSGTVEEIPAGVAVGELRGKRECVAVDAGNQHFAAPRGVDLTHKVWPLAALPGIGLILSDGHVYGSACLDARDAAQGPSADGPPQESILGSMEERHLPHIMTYEAMANIVGGI